MKLLRDCAVLEMSDSMHLRCIHAAEPFCHLSGQHTICKHPCCVPHTPERDFSLKIPKEASRMCGFRGVAPLGMTGGASGLNLGPLIFRVTRQRPTT